jgi:tetratricopeptide (TPR) repeat protein
MHGVPATLEGVVMARLDVLPPAAREAARVASVLGGSFLCSDLGALVGHSPDLAPLVDAGILTLRDDNGEFRHAILRDVAYSTISLADRRRLHAAAAQRLGARPAGTDGHSDALLAHHLEQAGEVESAVVHLARAGIWSLRGNANREALTQNGHGLALLARLPPERRRALRHTQIELELGAGEAAQRLSLYDEAVQHKDTALAALGNAIPRGAAAVPALLREVVAQFAHRRLPWLSGGRAPGPRELRLSAETAELVEIYFYRGEKLRSLYAALRALNLAEGGGDTPQLARGFGIVGTIAGFARLPGIAKAYGERALDVLSRVDDPVAAWWVPLVVGVSRLSAGDLAMASKLMDMTAAASERIRDRRHWRDAIGNKSIVLGLRGDWTGGLELSELYGATALEDRDIRYIVAAAREQAFYCLQLGRLDEAEQCLDRLRTEIDRGLKAEDAASRQDLHAIGAAVAMARGETVLARSEAEAGFAIMLADAGASSFPNMFWSLSLLFDTFLQLAGSGGDISADRKRAWTLVRALDRHAASHQIGRPAALRARGLYEQRFGWRTRARHWLDRAAATADALGMARGPEPVFAAVSGQGPLHRWFSWLSRSSTR